MVTRLSGPAAEPPSARNPVVLVTSSILFLGRVSRFNTLLRLLLFPLPGDVLLNGELSLWKFQYGATITG